MSSGPLSQRMHSGAVPRSATIRSSASTVASAVMLLAATIASASRVCSSTTLSSFSTRPSAVVTAAARGHTTLRGAVLSGDAAGPPFRERLAVLQHAASHRRDGFTSFPTSR